jgi:hypothetical protein
MMNGARKPLKSNEEATAKRKLNALRGKVAGARERWLTCVREHRVGVRVMDGGMARSPTRRLYLVRDGEWWAQIQHEIEGLERAIAKAGYAGARKPRALWLPVVIRNARTVTVRMYSAKSVRNISFVQARAFAKKAGCELRQSHGQYAIHAQTGCDYVLRVKSEHGIEIHPFSPWAVCLYHHGAREPGFRKSDKRRDLPDPAHAHPASSSGTDPDELICVYKNSALYLKGKSGLPDVNAEDSAEQDVRMGEGEDGDEDWD